MKLPVLSILSTLQLLPIPILYAIPSLRITRDPRKIYATAITLFSTKIMKRLTNEAKSCNMTAKLNFMLLSRCSSMVLPQPTIWSSSALENTLIQLHHLIESHHQLKKRLSSLSGNSVVMFQQLEKSHRHLPCHFF